MNTKTEDDRYFKTLIESFETGEPFMWYESDGIKWHLKKIKK